MTEPKIPKIPTPEEIEYDRMMNHPAIRQYRKVMKENPGLATEMRPTSFRLIIKDYEEQQEVIRSINNRFEQLRNNPPMANASAVRRLNLAANAIAAVSAALVLTLLFIFLLNPTFLGPAPLRMLSFFVILIIALGFYGTRAIRGRIPLWEEPHDLKPVTHEWEIRNRAASIAMVKILIEIPTSSEPQTFTRLETLIHTTLTNIFQHTDKIPSASDMDYTLRSALLPLIRELRVSVFRYHLFEPQVEKRSSGTRIGFRP